MYKKVGLGHFYRCISYAEILKNQGYESIFLYSGILNRDLQKILKKNKIIKKKIYIKINFNELTKKKILNIWLNRNFDWSKDSKQVNKIARELNCNKVVIDIPGISQKWISGLYRNIKKLVIDDSPVEKIKTNIIVNPNYIDNSYKYYYTIKKNQIYLGPNYIPFTNSLLKMRSRIRFKLDKIVIYLGSNISLKNVIKIIEVFNKFPMKIRIISEHQMKLKKYFKSKKIKFYNLTDDIYNFYTWADLAIGCCGISAWERCYLLLPSINYISANNQTYDAKRLHDQFAIINLGLINDFNHNVLEKNIMQIKKSDQILRKMSISTKKVFSKNKYLIQLEPIRSLCSN